jgi:mono/diheme cytochrome c family protein
MVLRKKTARQCGPIGYRQTGSNQGKLPIVKSAISRLNIMRPMSIGILCGILLVPIGGLIAISTGFTPVDSKSDPGWFETKIARYALRASVSKRAPKMENPLPSNTENLLIGLRIYRRTCSGCHGDYQKPSKWWTTRVYPRAPQFPQDLPKVAESNLFWVTKNGIRLSGMPACDGQLNDDDIWKVTSFLTHANSLPPEVAQEWHAVPPLQH